MARELTFGPLPQLVLHLTIMCQPGGYTTDSYRLVVRSAYHLRSRPRPERVLHTLLNPDIMERCYFVL